MLASALAHVQLSLAEGVAAMQGKVEDAAHRAHDDTERVGAAVATLARDTEASHRLLADAVREGAAAAGEAARSAVQAAAVAAKDAMVAEVRPPLAGIASELEEILRRLAALQSTREAATMDGIVAALERLSELIRSESATVQGRVAAVLEEVETTCGVATGGAATTSVVDRKVDMLLARPTPTSAPVQPTAPPQHASDMEDGDSGDELGASQLSAGEVVMLPDGVAMMMGGAVPPAPAVSLADGTSVRWYAAPLRAGATSSRPHASVVGGTAHVGSGLTYRDAHTGGMGHLLRTATTSAGTSSGASGRTDESDSSLLPLSPPSGGGPGSYHRTPMDSSPESIATTATREVERRLAAAAGESEGGLPWAGDGTGSAHAWVVGAGEPGMHGVAAAAGSSTSVWELDPAELSAGEVVVAEDISEGELVELLPLVGTGR